MRRAWWYLRSLLLLCALPLTAQNVGKLPDWAQSHAREGLIAAPPADADAWVLLDRSEFAYAGNGEIREHRFRLVRILSERALNEGTYVIYGLGNKSSRIKKLKGWNCRPDGEVTRIDKEDVLTVDADSKSVVSTGILTAAGLERVVKGSLVAFESLEVTSSPVAPSVVSFILQSHPIRKWEIDLARSDGWFTNLKQVKIQLDTRNLKPWLGGEDLHAGTALHLQDVPPLPRDESGIPAAWDVLPKVYVRFLDPGLTGGPSIQSWDGIAQWYDAQFQAKSGASNWLPAAASGPDSRLRQLHAWMSKEMVYRQVYLSAQRSWMPEDAIETQRKRYGDCKDLAALVASGARSRGLNSHPVLVRIADGHAQEDDPPGLPAFNHVIVALRIPRSLGLPAEVDSPAGRLLLWDPTSRFTPFGRLPATYRGRQVMVCTAEGARWLTVPDTAVVRPLVRFVVDATLEGETQVNSTLSVHEEGDHLGLRSALLEGGEKAFPRQVGRVLGLPPEATWALESHGEPLDLDSPFNLKITLRHPRGFRHVGTDWSLLVPGVPDPPEPIQRSGQARRYPVLLEGNGTWEFSGTLRHGGRWEPLRDALELQTPLRSLRWKASTDGIRTAFTLVEERKVATFDFSKREDGVRASRRDRSQMKVFLEEALSFKPRSLGGSP